MTLTIDRQAPRTESSAVLASMELSRSEPPGQFNTSVVIRPSRR
jgi:hypothetical protein